MTATTHDCFHPYFVDCIDAAVDAAGITPAQARAFKITADNDVRNFTGIPTGSLKRGDLLVTPRPVIMLRHNIDDDSSDDDDDDDHDMDDDNQQPPIDTTIPNDGFPTIAVEVGFSENYTSLLRDMRLWLEGAAGRVRVVILVNLIESPPVNLQPFVLDDSFDDDLPAASGAQQLDTARLRRFRREPGARYGPIMYRGHVLVGAITGTLELWRLDPTTKTPYMETRKVFKPLLPHPILEMELELRRYRSFSRRQVVEYTRMSSRLPCWTSSGRWSACRDIVHRPSWCGSHCTGIEGRFVSRSRYLRITAWMMSESSGRRKLAKIQSGWMLFSVLSRA